MKLLLDANISWRLCSILSEIWQYAKDNDNIIISQDEDFLHYLEIKGQR